MYCLLAQVEVGVEAVLSTVSLIVTLYFWFVQANRERPRLRFFQLGDFRANLRSIPGQEGVKRLCVQQMDSYGVLVANDSTRQNAIINFECSFRRGGQWVQGDWGYVGDDKPPYNIGPESSIALGLAFFFDVEDSFEIPPQLEFRVTFNAVSGGKFVSRFWLKAPNLSVQEDLHAPPRAA
ncbi:MAG: hypothetical protein AB8G99_13700 [Planctomycetaceae bacterium]